LVHRPDPSREVALAIAERMKVDPTRDSRRDRLAAS
jgi:hypothetical protein